MCHAQKKEKRDRWQTITHQHCWLFSPWHPSASPVWPRLAVNLQNLPAYCNKHKDKVTRMLLKGLRIISCSSLEFSIQICVQVTGLIFKKRHMLIFFSCNDYPTQWSLKSMRIHNSHKLMVTISIFILYNLFYSVTCCCLHRLWFN